MMRHFIDPTKVIGRVMTKEEAEEEEKEGESCDGVKADAAGIVASPKPMDIVKIDAISALSECISGCHCLWWRWSAGSGTRTTVCREPVLWI